MIYYNKLASPQKDIMVTAVRAQCSLRATSSLLRWRIDKSAHDIITLIFISL